MCGKEVLQEVGHCSCIPFIFGVGDMSSVRNGKFHRAYPTSLEQLQ